VDQETNPQALAFARQSTEWLRAARALAKQAGCEQAVSTSLGRIETLGHDKINVAIVSAPNSGKSSLINGLLERNLLPVSPIPSLSSFVIEGIPAGSPEKFVVANASRPLAQLADALKSAHGSPIQVGLALDHEWLRTWSLRLIEKPPLDADEKNLVPLLDNSVRYADIVVVVIDALMPMRRAEAELVRECAKRGVPMIAVVAKLARLAEEDRQPVLDYVRTQAEQYAPDVLVVDAAGPLKEVLGGVIERTDFTSVRFAQFKQTLLGALDAIAAAARTGAEAESKSQAERESEIQERKNQVESQNLIWMQIEQQLNQRREKVEEQIRNHLELNQQKTLDFLYYDLERAGDVKAWWERDLPFRLRHELQNHVAEISSSIDRQLSVDRKWLQDELHRQFKFPLAIGPDTAVTIGEAQVARKELPLTDSQKFKMVSRVGTAAAVLAAGTLLATAGIGGAVLATSVLAGLAAEHLNSRQTSQNREKVRSELNTLVGRSCVSFASDVSAKLKVWYDDVIGAVKACQGQWQEAQIQTLETTKQKSQPARPDWIKILRQTDSLFLEIQPQVHA
jgi:GTP-binding protein EngB required for normal cell division